MATKNIVPNADGEGQLGTSSKSWAQGHIDSITGTIATPAQGNITSLGTLTTLTVDNVIINGTTIGHTSDNDLLTLASGELTVSGNISIPDSGTIGCAADADLLTLASGALTVSGSASFTGNIGLTGSASNLNFSADQDANITMSATTSGTDGRDLSIFAGASSNTDADNGGDLILRGGNAGANGSSQIRFRTARTSHAYGITAEHLRIDSSGHIAIPRTYNDTSNQPVIYVDSTISSGASTYQGSLLLQAGGAGSASYGAGLRLHGHAHASSPGSVEVGLSAVSGATFTVDSFGAGGGVDILKVERDNYNTTIAGNLVIGTASKGIDFSAAADVASGESTASSTLDDYEEGTWTPTVESSGGSVTCSSCSAGQYTKIGRQVIVHFQFTLTNSSSGSGTLKITNLPFSFFQFIKN